MTVVVALSGTRALDPGGVLTDVAHLVLNDEDVVLVHGGSDAVDETLAALGVEQDAESSSGSTVQPADGPTVDASAMAHVNAALVTSLEETGVPAVGLSGVDGGLLTDTGVNDDLLDTLLADGYVPVVSSPVRAEDGPAAGADADYATATAAAVAGALDAELVVLADAPGVHADPDAAGTSVDRVETPADLDRVAEAADEDATATVRTATAALERGAVAVTVSDATANDPIVAARAGRGTRFTPGVLGDSTDDAREPAAANAGATDGGEGG